MGDEMLVEGNDQLIPTKVVNMSTLTMQGEFNEFCYS